MKKNDVKRDVMSEFEYDCMWMSVRYAVGRHTIASHQHAGDVVRNCYGRFESEERQEYEAYDICREIDNSLRWMFSFHINESELDSRDQFKPLDIFMDFLTKSNINDIEYFKGVSAIRVEYDKNTKEFYYNVQISEEEKNKYCSVMDIDDLLIWQMAANCLDRKCHKKAVLIDDSECEFFEGWTQDRNGQLMSYKKVRIPVDRFRNNASVLSYIPDESLKEIVEWNYLPY